MHFPLSSNLELLAAFPHLHSSRKTRGRLASVNHSFQVSHLHPLAMAGNCLLRSSLTRNSIGSFCSTLWHGLHTYLGYRKLRRVSPLETLVSHAIRSAQLSWPVRCLVDCRPNRCATYSTAQGCFEGCLGASMPAPCSPLARPSPITPVKATAMDSPRSMDWRGTGRQPLALGSLASHVEKFPPRELMDGPYGSLSSRMSHKSCPSIAPPLASHHAKPGRLGTSTIPLPKLVAILANDSSSFAREILARTTSHGELRVGSLLSRRG